MPTFYKTTAAPYPPQKIFDLVADVKRYPEFLPFCISITIHEDSEHHMLADMHIGYRGFSGAFQSSVKKNSPNSLLINQTHGSLKYLNSSWFFKPNPSFSAHSYIEFLIEFEASSWLVGKLISPLMEQLGDTMMQSFLQRADFLYGKNNT